MKKIFVVFLCLFLSSCVSGKQGNFDETKINIIDVALDLSALEQNKVDRVTSSFRDKLTNTLLNRASIYNKSQIGKVAGYTLKVNVTRVHFKNPVLAVVTGDANSIGAEVSLVNAETGQTLRSFKSSYVDGASAIVNGIAGAVLSVGVKREAAESTLAKGLSKNVLNTAFVLKKAPKGVSALKAPELFLPPYQPISPLVTQPEEPVEVVDAEEQAPPALKIDEPKVIQAVQ